ncbi:hypothetical protein ULMA_16290 [Patiriisocius marinus]|uniref:Lipoprotein n=1 Tax=Patiriisocius marinus TaxID=1397112 RepID=A0A5J4J123_9FLAO|nr:hypothetical protein [Patiriisocius marinus]GER59521.1 hypothetical protein ULMA_16290 [Patiriisocius marinus]
MNKITLLLLIAIVTTSCSSSKMTSSQWLSDDFKNQKIDRILVFANTEDSKLQKDFENEASLVLMQRGISALKMHNLFPNLEYKKTHSQDEIKQFVLECKHRNIDKVLFASQKSVSVDTVLKKSLHNYMNSLEPLKLGPIDEENLTYDTKEVITYTIQAAVYDIAVTTEDKPIATTTVKASNPKSKTELKARFLKAISKLFKNNR